jgi:hypothetical protein
MVLHPVPDPPPPSPGVEVVQIGQTNLAEYLGVTIEAGMPAEAARLLFSASFAADPDVELFIGRLDRRAVGTAVAIRSGSVSGIYAVGTLPIARRRGVGSALTWQPLTRAGPGVATRSCSRRPRWACRSTPRWGSEPSSSTPC